MFGGLGVVLRRPEGLGFDVDHDQLFPRPGRLGHERLHDAFVGHRRELAFEAPAPFRDEVREAATALAQRFGAREEVGDVVVARHRERSLGCDHVVVERAQAHAQVLFLGGELAPLFAAALLAVVQPLDLAAGEVQRDRAQLVDEAVVAARRVGLALERPELPAHLAEQVGEAEQVAFRRLEPALGLLPPLAELQDPGRLLDDRPAVLGAGVEHGVELALADDHVLLAADAGVGEQLLDVEQAARGAVDHVLRLTRAEERPGDRDLGELDRQQAGGVVDRERYLGPAEGGPLGGAGEDDVVHLAAAQRPGPLGAEHPGHRVDDVRLPGAVRADDDADAGLEVERRLVGEGLEALQRERT